MKRTLITLLTMSLLAIHAPVSAGAIPKPKTVLKDPAEDANGINDQGTGDGSFGDFSEAGADASEFADIISAGFSSDKKNLYVFIETQSTAQPIAGEGFRVRANPAAGGVYCLNFEIYFNGAQNSLAGPEAIFRDACNASDVPVKSEISALGGYMITVPRKGVEALGKGKALAAPQAQTFIYSGSSYPAGVAGPYLDTTKIGKDYKLKG